MTAYDVCIIGAGPGGLTALSAILEPYSNDQLSAHQATRAGTAIAKPQRAGRRQPRVCVVDPAPWLSSWKTRFAALGIQWLRSPAVAHPDVFDMGMLQSFAVTHGREDEMLECPAASDALSLLPEVNAGMWRLPSNALFLDFCDSLTKQLPHDFKEAKAKDIRGEDGDFVIDLEGGEQISSSAVVLALGFPGPTVMPAVLASLPPDAVGHVESSDGEVLKNLLAGERVLVVGGGLTAVQAAQLAHRKGCATTLLSRRPLTTRLFDVNIQWFNRRVSNGLHFDFLSKSPEERFSMIKATRGGGSVPPMYMKDLQAREASGGLAVVCGEIEAASRLGPAVEVTIGGRRHTFDKVVCACGHRPDCTALPLTRQLHQRWPTKLERGFPVLSQDLQWGSLGHLFVVGAMAALQVGPDAGNLMGLRRACQQIVNGALDLRAWIRDERSILGNIRGNRFSALGDSGSDDESTATDADSGASRCHGEPESASDESAW